MDNTHTIVVGVDFGTTYTAVAWADVLSPGRIEIISNWPTVGQAVGHQVPSEIAYDCNDRSKFSWGYNIGPDAQKIKWFKLCLELEQNVIELPLDLRTVDVICDYLSAVYTHVTATLHRRIDPAVMQHAALSFALTVPAIWSDSARKHTHDAAMKAAEYASSLHSKKVAAMQQISLHMFSEPECAALYALKDLDHIDSLRSKDRILVCDAGGGTVDIITYEIVQTSPLSIAECTIGSGDYCGSTFVDREFEKLFKTRMGPHYQSVSAQARQQAVKSFEGAKIGFRNQSSPYHFYINLPGVVDIEEAGVRSGNFRISREEMRELFDPVIDRIIDLISTQIKAVSAINSILLVGGFGESEYLYQRLCNWTNGTLIRVLQPREASTAVVRGAVIKGLEKAGYSKTNITRRVRRSYGVIINETFVEGKHRVEDRCVNVDTGQVLAKNQIRWIITKNETVSDDQVFSKTKSLVQRVGGRITYEGYDFHRDFRHLRMWKDNLVSCTLETPPARLDAPVTELCSITSDLTHLGKKAFSRRWKKLRPYYTAHYTLCLGVQNNNLTFALEFRGRPYGLANVDFD